jgi:hypothetical protein
MDIADPYLRKSRAEMYKHTFHRIEETRCELGKSASPLAV